MCGILVHVGNDTIDQNHPALNIISHRGPDGVGAQSFTTPSFKVGLGHRRLSIIDLSERGRQPMHYDGSLWITFNGEIYNYIELRQELEADGFQFHSSGDTEVILASYKKWGNGCLSRFNGMFAFCIYDAANGLVFLARDRFGVKPLYYWNSPTGFYAVSEIKQLSVIRDFNAAANREKLYHFLNSGDFDFDRETLWKDVFELEPGHYAELDLSAWCPGGSIRPRRWYAADFDTITDITFQDATAEFRRLLDDSIRLRLRADVPVGFLLSGGLDSSSLLGLSTRIPRSDAAALKTFSSCYENSSVDERPFIRDALKFTGADSSLHVVHPKEVPENLDNVIWHNDGPVRHGSPVPHWLLYKHIKEDNDFRKVIIEGQGGDEILCGYRDFFWSMLFDLLKQGSIAEFARQLASVRRQHGYTLPVVLTKVGRLALPRSVKYPASPALAPQSLVGSEGVPEIPIRREQPSIRDMHRARLKVLRHMLHYVDRGSMAHSREARVPFLDYRLVQFCVSLPTNYKIVDGTTKRILRKAVSDALPETIVKRTGKQGYSSPIPSWLQKDLRGFFRDGVASASTLPFVNAKAFVAGSEEFLAGRRPFDPVWWNVIAADRWLKIFKISV